MEQKLKKLFDYQRFAQNEKLAKLIQDTENRYAAELSDDDLSFVSAAGDMPVTAPETKDDPQCWEDFEIPRNGEQYEIHIYNGTGTGNFKPGFGK